MLHAISLAHLDWRYDRIMPPYRKTICEATAETARCRRCRTISTKAVKAGSKGHLPADRWIRRRIRQQQMHCNKKLAYRGASGVST